MFGRKPQMYYKGQERISSSIGGCCTLLVIVILCISVAFNILGYFTQNNVSFESAHSTVLSGTTVNPFNEEGGMPLAFAAKTSIEEPRLNFARLSLYPTLIYV